MTSNFLKFFFVIFIVFVNSSQQFDQLVDKWNVLAQIEGQFQKDHTLFSTAKCNPCKYLIAVYKDYVQLLIDDPQQGRQDKVKAFEFNIQQHHYNETLWDYDLQRLKIETTQNSELTETISRFTRNGLSWRYQFTLPIEGLILKGNKFVQSEYLVPSITLLFSLLIFVFLPLSSLSRRQLFMEIPRRTPLLSLIILSQAQHLLLIQVFIIGIKYLIHQNSFLLKCVWYFIFLIPFGFNILQLLFIYDSVKISFLKSFENIIKSARIRDLGVIFTFFIGIYSGLIILLIVDKHIWILVYFSFYFVWQILWSLKNKTYPYLTLNLYYVVLIAYQMFLSNFSPLIWFEQNTRTQILIFWGSLIGVYLLGSLIQKLYIGIQHVSQVIFEQSKNIEMGSAKTSEQKLDI